MINSICKYFDKMDFQYDAYIFAPVGPVTNPNPNPNPKPNADE